MLYLETSLLVAALTNEPQTRRMQLWLGEQEPGTLAISGWVATEFRTAIAVKLRLTQIQPAQRATILARFTQIVAESLSVLPVSAATFQAAAGLADQYLFALRAGDALHLAMAVEFGATLCTLDRRLAQAGEALGVQTTLL